MAQSSTSRVRFSPGAQRMFLTKGQLKLGWTKQQVATFIGIHIRTLNDWKREKFLMGFNAANRLSRKSCIQLPENIQIKEQYWYTTKGARKGGIASFRKQNGRIGDPILQKRAWKKWWEAKGKFDDNPIFRRKYVYLPTASMELAEFMGIMMGDGSLTARQITVTLHHIDDLAYSKFVTDLMRRLFRIRPSVYHSVKNSVNDIVLSRSELVTFLNSLGLPIGNKVRQQIDIPDWIKQNKAFATACVRGLVDTDGSVFTHSYTVNGKRYHYKKLSFSSRSEPLRVSVAQILADRDMSPRLDTSYNVRLDSIADMKKYFSKVGSHNPKHLKRYAQ